MVLVTEKVAVATVVAARAAVSIKVVAAATATVVSEKVAAVAARAAVSEKVVVVRTKEALPKYGPTIVKIKIVKNLPVYGQIGSFITFFKIVYAITTNCSFLYIKKSLEIIPEN